MPAVTAIYRYPVKGLSAQRLGEACLAEGETLPLDRMYAIENGPGAFDPGAPRHLPKVAFLCLMRDEQLATLRTALVTAGGMHELRINRGTTLLAAGDLRTPEGRSAIETFFAREMPVSLRGPPRVVSAHGHSFSDVKEKCVHIVNLASVRALEQAVGVHVDPLRFRANLYIDGLDPWAELDMVEREIAIGQARLKIFKRTVRCAATNVDPASGVRAGDLPEALLHLKGHRDLGIYAAVTGAGGVRDGDRLVLR